MACTLQIQPIINLKKLNMKNLINGLFCLSAALIITSCGNDKNSTTDSTETSASMSSDTSMSSMDHNMNANTEVDLNGTEGPANFTSMAASGGMMEVEAAKVAQKNATSKEVKELAQMIMTDHSKVNTELKKIATAKNLTIPDMMMSEHKSHVDMLSSKTGAEFDKAYLEMMDKDHMKDIDMFTKASNSLSDAELKAFAAKTLPALKKHMERVKAIQSKM